MKYVYTHNTRNMFEGSALQLVSPWSVKYVWCDGGWCKERSKAKTKYRKNTQVQDFFKADEELPADMPKKKRLK